jgi:2-aminoadipate transaminase
MKRSFIREILEHAHGDTISFAGGLPDPALFPLEALRQASDQVLRQSDALQYATSSGYLPLRQAIAEQYTREGFATHPDEILITSGSQQGLDIIARHHAQATITIEHPSYLGARNLFDLNRLTLLETPFKGSEVDLSMFENNIAKSKLAYLIPDFHNPTGHRMSITKRHQISQLLEASDTLLIEDAPYVHLYFDHFSPSISSQIPNRSYHLGSFSKILAPGLRLGWVRAHRSLIRPLVTIKEATDLHTASLTQQIVHAYLQQNQTHQAHLDRLRKVYQAKMEHLGNTLTAYLPKMNFEHPQGGMFLYGQLPGVDTDAFLKRCMDNGVIFVPGIHFGDTADTLRLNFTNSTMDEITEGVRRMSRTL